MKSWKEKSELASPGLDLQAFASGQGCRRDKVRSGEKRNQSPAPMLRLRSVRSAQARVLVLRRLLARTLAVSLRESEVLVLPLFPSPWEMISLLRRRHRFLPSHLRCASRRANTCRD